MSRYKKAAAAMLFLFIIWVSFFLLLFLLKWVHLNKLLSYKGEIDIFIERNDQGTEVYTFLSEEKEYYKNMVILGASSAKNLPLILERQVKNYLDSIVSAKEATDYYLNVWNGSALLKSFGNKPKTTPQTTMLNQPLGTQLGNSISLGWPVRNYNTIGDGYGWRMLKGRLDPHGGIDFAVPEGTEVYPAYPTGKVVRADSGCDPSPDRCASVSSCSVSKDMYCCCNSGLGNFIVLEHEINGEKFYTHYDHLKEILVKKDDNIKQDAPIGKSGTTGYSTGYHLHFELGTSQTKSDASSVNPCPYFPQPIPAKCQQESYKTTALQTGGVFVDIPLPNGGKGSIELMI